MHKIHAKTILSAKNGMNLYRGCTHGCIYCDSRSTVYGMDHDFEDVAVKDNGLQLLEKVLMGKRSKCMIGTGSMSDPYMPLEAELEITRGALKLIERYGFGATLITKSDLVLRDIDLLASINSKSKAVVQMTMTTADEELCRKLEPGVCTTARRYEVLKELQKAGIPTVVWLTPVLPYINDTEANLKAILDYCADAGVKGIICFGMGLTLREGNREYFYSQLDRLFPGSGFKERYIKDFGLAYNLVSPENNRLMRIFRAFCQDRGIMDNPDEIFRYMNFFEEKEQQTQLSMF
ncbi:MAG: radical SAM protein [Firmicutes bacterium]|nr:radical SAM protein [Bacillota bacterium]